MKNQVKLFLSLFMTMILTLSAILPSMVSLAETKETQQSEYYENSPIPKFDTVISYDKVSKRKLPVLKSVEQEYTYATKNNKDAIKCYENDIEEYRKLLSDHGWKLSQDWKDESSKKHKCIYTDNYGLTVCITADKVSQKPAYSLTLAINYEGNPSPIYLTNGTQAYVPLADVESYLSNGWYDHPVVAMKDLRGKTKIVPREKLAQYENIGWVDVSTKMEVYSPDGSSETILKSDFADYKNKGWYDYPVIKIYSSDGTSKVVPESEFDTWKSKGWFDDSETLVEMYTSDGKKHLLMPESESAEYKKNGWIDSRDKIKIYSPNGQTSTIAKHELQSYKNVGWYDYPVTTIYAPDGRSQVVAISDVVIWEIEGWIDSRDKVKIYSPDGSSSTIPKYQLQSYKNVGWYDYPVTTVHAPDGRSQVIVASDVAAWENMGWIDVRRKTTVYSPNETSASIPLYQLQSYKNVGWYEYPVTKVYNSDTGEILVVAKADEQYWINQDWLPYAFVVFTNISEKVSAASKAISSASDRLSKSSLYYDAIQNYAFSAYVNLHSAYKISQEHPKLQKLTNMLSNGQDLCKELAEKGQLTSSYLFDQIGSILSWQLSFNKEQQAFLKEMYSSYIQ